MAASPRAAARLAVDRAHGREDGGRRLTGRDLTQSSGPGAEVAATWSATRAGAKGEEEEKEAPGIGRPTTHEAFQRAAANRSERLPPAARGG
uniref:Kinase substrate protein-like n=1 Tax=Oryza sativa subsp. japonica TaxID=39947 RepID=Q5Z5A7_ORYSJ|nr:kinase substrate protein-like [Oryza sativa Japonica Group]